MKKRIIFLTIVVAGFALSTSSAYALGDFASSTSEVYVGDSFTVSLTINEVAAWNVHIDSVGPVKDCNLADADVTEDAKNTTKNFSVNCKAIGAGEISVTLSGDYTSEDGVTKDLSGSTSISVKTQDGDNDSDEDDDSGKDKEKQEGEGDKKESGSKEGGKDDGSDKDGKKNEDLDGGGEKDENEEGTISDISDASGTETDKDGGTGVSNTGVFTNSGDGFAKGVIGTVVLAAIFGAVIVFRNRKQRKNV